MKDTKEMLSRQVNTLRAELERSRDRISHLENAYDNDVKRLAAQVSVETRRASDAAATVERLNRRVNAVFERHDVEAMTRQQLVSLIEEAINEARRKGLTEAEGLLSRHREHTNTTDLELMRGIVRTYQDRIAAAEHEAEVAKLKATPVKLDTRPLSEKLTPAGATGTSVKNSSNYHLQAPGWWRAGYAPQIDKLPEMTVTPPPPAGKPSNFATFNLEAERREAQRKYDAFTDSTKRVVSGTSGGSYVLSRSGSVFRCSCPAWTFSPKAAETRTCKHLARYFGQDAETHRINHAAPPPTTKTHCWCGLQLLRGQCPEHTRDWKGEELCECGRKFASCKAAYNTISVAQRAKGHQPQLARSNGMRW